MKATNLLRPVTQSRAVDVTTSVQQTPKLAKCTPEQCEVADLIAWAKAHTHLWEASFSRQVKIGKAIAEEMSVPWSHIRGSKRTPHLLAARRRIWYELRLLGYSLTEIGAVTSTSHSTVLKWLHRVGVRRGTQTKGTNADSVG